jgi:hypothetical protein
VSAAELDKVGLPWRSRSSMFLAFNPRLEQMTTSC